MKTLGTLLILIATMLAGPAQAEAPDRADCRQTWRQDTVREDYGGNDRWIDMTLKVTFDQCQWRRSGKHFIDPRYYTVAYNIQGSHVGCGFPNAFERVEWHVYLWDAGGRNYNEAGALGCREDTTASDTNTLMHAPVLRHCSGEPPKAKANFETIIRFEHNDHATARMDLWDLVGPVGSSC